MSSSMRELIDQNLATIESNEGLRICHAVESGSRAWGFESADSDYDVRFIYVRPESWYQSIDLERRPDTFVPPIDGDLDVSGWDIRKTLQLFRKSNPQLLEWLQCSIVYVERFGFAERLRGLLPEYHDPRASFYHYLRMAQSNFRNHLRGDSVQRKQYLYVLRPLLAIRWVEQYEEAAPIEFDRLVDGTLDRPVVRRAIDQLVAQKKNGMELDLGPKISPLSQFIEEEFARHSHTAAERPTEPRPVEPLNELMQLTLREAWASEDT